VRVDIIVGYKSNGRYYCCDLSLSQVETLEAAADSLGFEFSAGFKLE